MVQFGSKKAPWQALAHETTRTLCAPHAVFQLTCRSGTKNWKMVSMKVTMVLMENDRNNVMKVKQLPD